MFLHGMWRFSSIAIIRPFWFHFSTVTLGEKSPVGTVEREAGTAFLFLGSNEWCELLGIPFLREYEARFSIDVITRSWRHCGGTDGWMDGWSVRVLGVWFARASFPLVMVLCRLWILPAWSETGQGAMPVVYYIFIHQVLEEIIGMRRVALIEWECRCRKSWLGRNGMYVSGMQGTIRRMILSCYSEFTAIFVWFSAGMHHVWVCYGIDETYT